MKKYKLVLPLLFTVFCLSGCMALFRTKTGTVTFVTIPPGAEVSYGYSKVTTPGPLKMPRDRSVVVLITKPGYEEVQIALEPGPHPGLWVGSIFLNATHGIFTLGITFVLGLIYDTSTGVLNEFESDVVTVRLRPSEKPKQQ